MTHKKDDPLPPTVRRPEAPAANGEEMDGLLESLTGDDDDYRDEQPTLRVDVEEGARPTSPSPASPAPPAEPKVPLPGRLPRPRASDVATAKPPAVNPAGPASKEPFPPAASPSPGRAQPRPALPRAGQKKFMGPAGFDDSEIDAALMPLSEPPPPVGPSTPPTAPPPPTHRAPPRPISHAPGHDAMTTRPTPAGGVPTPAAPEPPRPPSGSLSIPRPTSRPAVPPPRGAEPPEETSLPAVEAVEESLESLGVDELSASEEVSLSIEAESDAPPASTGAPALETSEESLEEWLEEPSSVVEVEEAELPAADLDSAPEIAAKFGFEAEAEAVDAPAAAASEASPAPEPAPPEASSAAEAHVEISAASDEDLEGLEEILDAARPDASAKIPDVHIRPRQDSRPAAAQLGDQRLIEAWVARAEWFEEEAQATEDASARARLLLASSELWAMAGNTTRARDIAKKAVHVAPALALAGRQARFLAALEGDWKAVATALDVEARAATTDAARAHASYVAAEVHRLKLQDPTNAEKRLDLVARAAPSDPRPLLMKTSALLTGKEPAAAPKWPDGPELAPLLTAAQELARLRGWTRVASFASTSAAVAFEEARRALQAKRREPTGTALLALKDVPGVGLGARFLAAALLAVSPESRARSIEALTELLGAAPGRSVRRALAARALEHGDAGGMTSALAQGDGEPQAFAAADRVALGALAGGDPGVVAAAIASLLGDEASKPLAAACAAALSAGGSVPIGDPATRAFSALGRRLATVKSAEELKESVHAVRAAAPQSALGRILALELDAAASATSAVAAEISRLAPPDQEALGRLGAALLEESAGHAEAARRLYSAALASSDVAEAAARALLPPGSQNASDLLSTLASSLGEEPSMRRALLLYEAAIRGDLSESSGANGLLQQAHEAAPEIPLAARLGGDVARLRGDAPLLLEWIRKQRAATEDPISRALHLVREAFFIADDDAAAAAERVAEALESRPTDAALHELLERLDDRPDPSHAEYREKLAETAPDDRTRLWLLVCAALEYERAGSPDLAAAAARTARALDASGCIGVMAERLSPEQAEKPLTGLAEARAQEQTLLGTDRAEELESIALRLTELEDPGEASAHARFATRLRLRHDAWDSAKEIVERAFARSPRSLWTLRRASAYAHAAFDDARILESDRELAGRVSGTVDAGTLALRAAEAAARVGKTEEAVALLDRTLEACPEHLVARDLRAHLLEQRGDFARAAEDLEKLAAECAVPEHQFEAWYRAAVLWLDRAASKDRGLAALERAAALNALGEDVFDRLQLAYVERGERAKLAELLERRLAQTTDPEERIALEVTRGRALADVGDRETARQALGAALAASPDHLEALSAYADLCAADQDWKGAEESWIRLARVAAGPEKQAAVYEKLARLYETNLPNPQRAEICWREILKRRPEDAAALEALVQVYVRQGNVLKAVETQTLLVDRAVDNDLRRDRTLALAKVYDDAAQDKKSSFAILEKARKAWPHDPAVLRGVAEHHARHGETAALNVLLDRATAEARRALSHGRFDPAFFAILRTAAEIRGQADAGTIATATLAALEGTEEPAVTPAGAAAFRPDLDDLLAPDLFTPALRSLLQKLCTVLETAHPVDLKSLRAAPAPLNAPPALAEIRKKAEAAGLGSPEILVSPVLGAGILPVSSTPPKLVVGEVLLELSDAQAVDFAVYRAVQLLRTHASVFTRIPPVELWPITAALLKILAPSFQPQSADAGKLADAERKLRAALPPRLDDDVPTLALDVAGSIGNRASQLGQAVSQWASRAALLATGSPSASLRGLALVLGQTEGLPQDAAERLKWVLRNAEAKDVAVFSVSEAYADARRKAGLSG